MNKPWTQIAMELLDAGYVVDHYDYNPRTQQFSGCVLQKAPATYNELQQRGLTLKQERLIEQPTGRVLITWLIDLKALSPPSVSKARSVYDLREEVLDIWANSWSLPPTEEDKKRVNEIFKNLEEIAKKACIARNKPKKSKIKPEDKKNANINS